MYKSSKTAVAEPVERKSSGQKAVERFTEMMIGRMEAMKAGDWKKGWIDGEIYGLPQNISGRCYSGSNSLFLQMHAAMNGFSTPVYMTFLQIQKEGARVNSGAEAMPVAYWDFIIQDKDGRRVKSADYRRLSKEEQKGMTVIPFMKAYNVFNIDQTNLREVSPEKYAALQEQFRSPELRDKSGMYVNEALDRLFERQEWLCPIQTDKARPHRPPHEGAVPHQHHTRRHLQGRHGVLLLRRSRDGALHGSARPPQPHQGRQVRRREIRQGGTSTTTPPIWTAG